MREVGVEFEMVFVCGFDIFLCRCILGLALYYGLQCFIAHRTER